MIHNTRKKKSLSLLLCGGFLLLFALASRAQEITPPGFEQTVILPKTDLVLVIARIINVALSFLGVVAVILIIYGGFVWMTAGGNEEKIATAKRVLKDAGIGLVIILSAFAIAQFIFSRLGVQGEAVPLAAPSPLAFKIGGGALGGGIVESHYPRRGEINVYRNTKIVITFKEAINPASIANTPDTGGKYYDEVSGNKKFVSGLTLKNNAIQIIKAAEMGNSVRDSDPSKYIGAIVSFTSDLRTFVLSPQAFLGSATENVSYNVYLCGAKTDHNCAGGGIKLLSGDPAFAGNFSDYQWSFETGTLLDVTPPKITSVIPLPDNEMDVNGVKKDRQDKPRNTLIQINFSEPVLPTVVSGKTVTNPMPPSTGSGGAYTGESEVTGTFDVLHVYVGSRGDATYLAGEWQIGNQYKTVEFTSADLCGKNACGQDVFCLPSSADINLKALAAALKDPLDTKSFVSAGLMDGVEDLAGNSLDGNPDNIAKGPTANFYNRNNDTGDGDSVIWSFWTSGNIDLTSPIIESTVPIINGAGVALAEPVEIIFTKPVSVPPAPMSITTLNSRNINLSGQETATAKPWNTFWTVEAKNMPAPPAEPEKTKAIIIHGGLWELSDFQSLANQGVKDIYQNCFYPSSGGAPNCVGAPYCCDGAPSATECF